jgi:uncharacterized membrane protein YadS
MTEVRASAWAKLYRLEDWWAVWLGLGIVLAAVALYLAGAGAVLGDLAVAPPKWQAASELGAHFAARWHWYLALGAGLLALFTTSIRIMGRPAAEFAPGFAVLFVASAAILVLSSSQFAQDYNLEAPLLALIVGLVAGNVARPPAWLEAALRTEYYVKTGIVLLGATLPLTLVVSAGPIAFLQATIVSITTWLVIYFAATRLFRKEPQFGAVLGAAGSVCGVSAAIAVGAAVKARKEQIAISISVVTLWSIVMIFVLPLASRALGLPTAQAGAWIGTSEFADAAGFAAASAYDPPVPRELADAIAATGAGTASEAQLALIESTRGHYDKENAIRAFTLMKVIGRDIWIGIWCFVLSIVAVLYWEKRGGGEPGTATERLGAGVIWDRFPKFVIGFLVASLVVTLLIEARGAQDGPAFKELSTQLIAPIKTLRTWTFVLTFLCIGLTTRFQDLARAGWQPFWAFTLGVAINVPLGYFLSVHAFGDFWLRL